MTDAKSNTFEQELLELGFLGTVTPSGILDTMGVSIVLPGTPPWWMTLHSADPGEAGDMSTNELNYSGSSRFDCPIGGTFWEVVDEGSGVWTARNKIQFLWPTKKLDAGSVTANYVTVGIGDTIGVADEFAYRGTITGGLVIAQGAFPLFPAGIIKIREK